MSSNCVDGTCKGKGEGETCSEDFECDVDYSCVPSENFPFETKCTKLLGEGKECTSDLVCKINFTCWPQTTKDALISNYTCTEMYVRDIDTEIGYMEEFSSTFRNSLNAGELCKSGFALIKSKTTAICAEISYVRTNLDNYASKVVDAPYKCSLNKTYATP